MSDGQQKITKDEVKEAANAWCAKLVKIGKVYRENGIEAAREYAKKEVLQKAYDYVDGQVFFKPTYAHGDQTFRPTLKGALAYFVGGDEDYPDDRGFAIHPHTFTEARYINLAQGPEGVRVHCDIGITMGYVELTDSEGGKHRADKTWVFKKYADNDIRIIAHHSSIPYTPEAKKRDAHSF